MNKTRLIRFFTPVLLACAAAFLYGLPDAALPGICKELVAGTTAGRQALVGSCWHAPLSTLIYLPFAWALPPVFAERAGSFLLWWFYFAAASTLLAGFVGWCINGKTGHLVRTASAGALLLLCGAVFIPVVCVLVLLLPFAGFFHRETRRRFFAWVFLGWLPVGYAAGVWILLNALILGDGLFFVRSLNRETLRRYKVAQSQPQRAGRLPDAYCLGEAAKYVDDRTEYGRIFVLGYAGLRALAANVNPLFTPNLDLHLDSIRDAYKGQDLYFLVPRPQGLACTESVFWRYPDIYTHGAERLLFAKSFGEWHLFQLVQAPSQEQLDEWKRSRNNK
ncbi:MAG: hypothetical protein J5985_04065 [Kiritimatiellae bacterium]|nr:hypothetical protein [Kiritimatiellia bacterium]